MPNSKTNEYLEKINYFIGKEVFLEKIKNVESLEKGDIVFMNAAFVTPCIFLGIVSFDENKHYRIGPFESKSNKYAEFFNKDTVKKTPVAALESIKYFFYKEKTSKHNSE